MRRALACWILLAAPVLANPIAVEVDDLTPHTSSPGIGTSQYVLIGVVALLGFAGLAVVRGRSGASPEASSELADGA